MMYIRNGETGKGYVSMNKTLYVIFIATALGACSQIGQAPVDGEVSENYSIEEIRVSSWIVDTEPALSEEEVAAVAASAIPGQIQVDPLFPDNDDLKGMYIVSAEETYSEQDALDIAYALKDNAEISDAVPDFEIHEPIIPRSAALACTDGAVGAPIPSEMGWSLSHMRADEAWAIPPEPVGKIKGEGVRICHPDSGWADHQELDASALDLSSAMDLIDPGSNGEDPLNYSGNPGHGTATGSVLISRGDVDADGNTIPGGVTGVAPAAELVPIRTIKSVARFFDSNVAKAVGYARTQSCDVVSMSLGGAGFFGLKKVIRKAVEEDDMIVVSASGNCVGFIVAPASYSTTIAAAASNSEREPWKGSSRGGAITMTAPGEGVYIARRREGSSDLGLVETSNGTSYATTAIAAAAANWLAFHGKQKLNDAKGDYTMSDLFKFALEDSVDTPTGWDTDRYGPGILDLKKLLAFDVNTFPKDQPRSLVDEDTELLLLSRTIDRTPAQTRALLTHLYGEGDPEKLAETYGPELRRLAVTKPDVIESLLNQVDRRLPRSAIGEEISDHFSSRMREAVSQ